jgi:hypothetical protein
VLAEIGGLYSALKAGFGVFCVLFGHWNLQSKMAHRLYEPYSRPTARSMVGKAFINNEPSITKLEKPECYDFKKLLYKIGCRD